MTRTSLVRIDDNLNADGYFFGTLRRVVVSYLQALPNTLCQQDNARPHVARPTWPPYLSPLSATVANMAPISVTN
ncbi:hypothetical protein TNCV_4070621 [Trichonephila clavipes]|nr:hypothetical protein TNCV_4070621 [Trichonephila clavipes]